MYLHVYVPPVLTSAVRVGDPVPQSYRLDIPSAPLGQRRSNIQAPHKQDCPSEHSSFTVSGIPAPVMPLSDTPAPLKTKKASKLITDLSNVTQNDPDDADPEASEFDLGKKINTPKEVMLEELSLLKNKGSRMFKMRQQRVERFVYENNPELLNEESVLNAKNLIVGAEIPVESKQSGGKNKAPEPEAEISNDTGALVCEADGSCPTSMRLLCKSVDSLTGEKEAEREKHVRTYTSPWERAMKGDQELLATMKPSMPGPHVHQEPPLYKSFNRTPLPYGGFEKASTFMTFQPLETLAPAEEPEQTAVRQLDITTRPSFNRTPIGWVYSGEPSCIHVELKTVPFEMETDEL